MSFYLFTVLAFQFHQAVSFFFSSRCIQLSFWYETCFEVPCPSWASKEGGDQRPTSFLSEDQQRFPFDSQALFIFHICCSPQTGEGPHHHLHPISEGYPYQAPRFHGSGSKADRHGKLQGRSTPCHCHHSSASSTTTWGVWEFGIIFVWCVQ